MAEALGGFPFWGVAFDEQGGRVGDEADRLIHEVGSWRLSDLFVFSHGWNASKVQALDLDEKLLTRVHGLMQDPRFATKRPFRPGVVGILWPSTVWTGGPPPGSPAPATATATGGPDAIRDLEGVFTRPGQPEALDELKTLLRERPEDEGKVWHFQDLLRRLVPSTVIGGAMESDLPRVVAFGDALEVFGRLGSAGPAGSGVAAGLGAIWDGAWEALRLAVAWEMRARAGVIGRKGVGPLLDDVQTAERDLRLNLIGHGYGARMLAYALAGLKSRPSPVKSLTLLQGTFSHHAFSPKLPHDPTRSGALAGKLARVDGPVLITFSKFDTSVRGFEAISDLAAPGAAGSPDDLWQVMGHDGARGVEAESREIGPAFDTPYNFHPGLVYNLDCSAVVKDGPPPAGAHGDIVHADVAWAFLSAAGLFTSPADLQPGDAIAAGAAGGLNDPRLRQSAGLPLDEDARGDYIVELNLLYEGGVEEAAKQFRKLLREVIDPKGKAAPPPPPRLTDALSGEGVNVGTGGDPLVNTFPVEPEGRERVAEPSDSARAVSWASGRELERLSVSYYHCLLSVREWRELLRRDESQGGARKRAVYRLWPDHLVEAQIDRSVATVKADAARRSFDAGGAGIVWAVVDSGIDKTHPHFHEFQNVTDESVAQLHRDFTVPFDEQEESGETVGTARADELDPAARPAPTPVGQPRMPGPNTCESALTDPYGHGTHVAGIIAGGLAEKAAYVPPSRRADPNAPPETKAPAGDPEVAPMSPAAAAPPPPAGAAAPVASMIVSAITLQARPPGAAPGADAAPAPATDSGPANGSAPQSAPGAKPATADDCTYRVFQKVFDYDVSGLRKSQKIEERNVPESARLRGVAPNCKLVSLRVLREDGRGRASKVMKALQYVRVVNGEGKVLVIHGVNLSIGYEFDAELFACGQSPLCTEVDRLVRSGVVVVAAAGNTGYGQVDSYQRKSKTGLSQTINDPGNADRAITVGSTHRESPHTYGVSFFSSKGPTGDGRLKPDLVAPGERITSCAVGSFRKEIPPDQKLRDGVAAYLDRNGTSMAAPHVSGAIAAFLSIRREFIQRPEDVKRIFLDSAISLGRERYFEGHGMVDLMKAIQSV